MIHASDLTRTFGQQRVLDGLALHIRKGERVALLGLNGAGKTTLFRCLLGLLRYEGELRVDGMEVRAEGRAIRERLGYVPQRPPRFEGTLSELVVFFSGLRGVDPHLVVHRLEELDLSLGEHGAKAVGALSGGMLQKVLLALAVAAEVPVLLLDEPTANLDPRARKELVRALRRIPEGTTVFLSSHRLEDIRAAADRLLVLHDGRIRFDGTVEELQRRSHVRSTAWIRVPESERAAVTEKLTGDRRVTGIVGNGTAIGIEISGGDLPDLVAEIRSAGLPILELRTESPPLEALLEPWLPSISGGSGAESGEGEAGG